MGDLREPVLARARFETANFSLDGRSAVGAPDFARNGHAPPRLTQLARAIEAEVLPRLILARRGARVAPPSGGEQPRAEQIVECARLSLTDDAEATAAFVETIHAQGMSVETLYLELLAPAARHLGDQWVDDRCSFTEVTLGLMRLQQVMRVLSPAFQREGAAAAHEHRVLLSPLPGEQHSFGLFMVAEFFHRAGWRIWSGPLGSVDELIRMVNTQWFAVAGLSVSSTAKLQNLATLIRTIRRESRNPGIGVMVGGQIFNDHPEAVLEVGADATAADGPRAVVVAQGLLELRGRHV